MMGSSRDGQAPTAQAVCRSLARPRCFISLATQVLNHIPLNKDWSVSSTDAAGTAPMLHIIFRLPLSEFMDSTRRSILSASLTDVHVAAITT